MMEKNNVELEPFDELRHRAQDFWSQRVEECQSTSKNDVKKLIHAFQVHQIELEIQNEELRKSQAQLEEAKHKEVEKRTVELVQTNEKLRRELKNRKRAEKALLESEQRYRAVVESQTELICRFLPDGSLTFVNTAYSRCFGKKPAELIGQRFLDQIPQEDLEKVEKHLAAINRDNPIATIKHRVKQPDGAIRWQQWIDHANFDDQGRVKEYQSVGRDITEQVQAEEALHEAHKKLENRVQKRSLQLKISAEELNAKQKELLNSKFELEQLNKELLETNKAISVLAKYIDKNREKTESSIARTINSNIMPFIDDLRRSKTLNNIQSKLDILVTNMRSLSSGLSGGQNLMDSLTPTEVRVATMIKNSMTSQAIAEELHVTLHTVNTHRRNIRKKLNVRNSDVNLVSYLRTIM
jgi:PAS domain S-box-containing protein